MLRPIALVALVTTMSASEGETPWVLKSYLTEEAAYRGSISARFMTLRMCEQAKMVFERSCVWKKLPEDPHAGLPLEPA